MIFFHQKEVDNRLDFFKAFQPDKKASVIFWFLGSVIFGMVLSFALFSISFDKQIVLRNFIERRNILQKKITTVQPLMKKLHELELRTKQFGGKAKKILLRKQEVLSFLSLFDRLSSGMGGQTRLQSASVRKKEVLLLGKTYDGKEVIELGELLSGSEKLSHVKLTHFSKRPAEGFQFRFSGKLYSKICQK